MRPFKHVSSQICKRKKTILSFKNIKLVLLKQKLCFFSVQKQEKNFFLSNLHSDPHIICKYVKYMQNFLFSHTRL